MEVSGNGLVSVDFLCKKSAGIIGEDFDSINISQRDLSDIRQGVGVVAFIHDGDVDVERITSTMEVIDLGLGGSRRIVDLSNTSISVSLDFTETPCKDGCSLDEVTSGTGETDVELR
jgi:hypothetical protein